jgi:hypothetical protein
LHLKTGEPSNLRQIGLATGNYNAQMGKLPAPATYSAGGAHSALQQLLPWLEQDAHYRTSSGYVDVFWCPSDLTNPPGTVDFTSYIVNINGWSTGDAKEVFTSLATIPAGRANVIEAGDITSQNGKVTWNSPSSETPAMTGIKGSRAIVNDPNWTPDVLESFHSPVNVLLFDAHVERVTNSANVRTGADPSVGNTSRKW